MLTGNIDSIIFDFGGTLDTGGIHWFNKFAEVYTRYNLLIETEELLNAYIYAEKHMMEYIKPDDSYFRTLYIKTGLQLDQLGPKIKSKKIIPDQRQIVQDLYDDVVSTINYTRLILQKLYGKYKLGIASNFYGNLETVLQEFAIRNYFTCLFDSAVYGIRKPDPEVFSSLIKKLGSVPQNCLILGDSYTKDIEPGKKIGCITVWLCRNPLQRPETTRSSDLIIGSLDEFNNLMEANSVQR